MSYGYGKPVDVNTDIVHVSTKDDVPRDRHYAVLIYKTSSVYIPGDERSKMYPGHGYPERTETYDSFEHHVTKSAKVLEEFVRALHHKGEKNYVFFEVPALGKLEVSVNIKVEA